MQQGIYVDVLLVTNYIVNLMLIACVAKLSGRAPKRRRIIAAALFGALTSLTIFLPFMGFFVSVLSKLVISCVIVLLAFTFYNVTTFLKQLFLFFAVSFSFAGVILGIWIAFSPQGMSYYNGVVYFDISALWLIAATVAAYIVLTAASRFSKGKSPGKHIYKTIIELNGKTAVLNGFVDTGNHLYEPFSNVPVVVCFADDLKSLLPENLLNAIACCEDGAFNLRDFSVKIRMIPYSNVKNTGVIPAVKAGYVIIESTHEVLRTEQVYIGISPNKIGNEQYNCLLHPDLVCINTDKNTVMVVP